MPELFATLLAPLADAVAATLSAGAPLLTVAQDAAPVLADAAGAAGAAADTAAASGGALADMADTVLAGKLESYLFVSGVLFLLGLATILTRRNALYVLMGVELILNAANLNFVAFARFGDHGIDGQLVALTVIVIAAAEAAIGLAIVLRVFHDFGSVDMTRTDSLRD